MKLEAHKVILRPVQLSDKEALATLANNQNIAKNLRSGFPNPYTLNHAEEYIRACISESDIMKLAIEYDGQFVGMIGFVSKTGFYSKTAEVGYWLGEPFWGRGIMTIALKLITKHAFDTLKLKRIEAALYTNNQVSKRVLEKCGYELEGIAKSVVIKDNRFEDEWRYAIINPNIIEAIL